MADKRRDLPAAQANLIWAASGNRCAYLDCTSELITLDRGHRVNIGEIAHIHAQSKGGPRYRADLTDAQVDSFENCMLLCRKHHRIIDSNSAQYPADLLRSWKAKHEEKYAVGALAAVRNSHIGAPPPRAYPFAERPELAEQIRDQLADGSRCSLVGVSGSGKSQLAISFLEDADIYTFKWWIRATTPELFETELAAIGAFLGIEAHEKVSPRDIALQVRAALDRTPGWLLVIDDAGVDVDAALIPSRSGNVVVTTQNAGTTISSNLIEIPPFDEVQSRSLLRDLAPKAVASDAELNELASLCAGLPLALAQVGSYLASTNTPISEYVELVRVRRADLMARGSGGTHATLDVTISAAMQRLTQGGRAFIGLLSMLAPTPIDLSSANFDEIVTDSEPDPSDPLGFEDIVAELRSWSLIERAGATVVTHELIQIVVRKHLDDDARNQATLLATGIILDQVPERVDIPTEWLRMEQLLPHITVIVDRLQNLPFGSSIAAALLNRSGLYHHSRGASDLARSLYARALESLGDSDLNPDDIGLKGSLLNNLGNLQAEYGDLEGAEETLRESIRCKRAGSNPDSALVGIAVAALATIVEQMERFDDARDLHLEALEIYRQAGDEARIADCLVDLANLSTRAGDLTLANTYLDEAISISESMSEYWPELSSAHLAKALFYEEAGEPIKAIISARRAVVIARNAAPESVQLARALSTQGRLLAAIDPRAGTALMDKGHTMFINVGTAPVDLARTKGNLGAGMVAFGIDVQRGLSLLRESKDIASNVLPAGHHTLQLAIAMLADGLARTGDHGAAIEQIEILRQEEVSEDIAQRIHHVLHLLMPSAALYEYRRDRLELGPDDDAG